MELSKLYYVYGLDTSCFYTDEENKIEQSLFRSRQMKQKLKKKLKAEDIGLHDQYRQMIKFVNKYINNKKQQLKDLIEANKDLVRNVRREKIITKQGEVSLRRVVSIFDSTLTRLLELKERELNTEILIVSVYFFGVAQSIVENGFYMNGEKYVFFSSSAGQIRTKKMVCVKESLLKKHWDTLTCGLTVDHINEKGGMNINKYLAYLALCNSATEHWQDFDIKRAIVVDDFENCVQSYVDYIDDITYEVSRRTENVPIPHTDGCGIMLPTVSKKNFMIRLPWFKGLLGVFDFRKFIAENNCSPVVTDIYGVPHNVIDEDVQIIFTKSQFKMWSYFENWDQYVNNFIKYNCQAGICNIEEDEMFNVTINYQMIQSLIDITDDELEILCKDSSDFIDSLAKDSKSMLKAFGATAINHNRNAFQNCLMKYPELLSDPFCRSSLKDIKRSLEKDLWSAKFRVNGYYTFILPDLYAFCEHLFKGEEYPVGLLKNNEVHCNLFEFGKEVDCLRSPHLYMEHAIRNNVGSDEMKKWFKTKAIYTSCHDIISKVLMFDDH